MSTFKVPVIEIEVFDHPNADRLDVAKATTMDYHMIIPKGQYKTGDTVVYIPEQAIVPESILQEIGLEGKLAGKDKNRVKAMRLRGIVSQGIVYPNKTDVPVGTDMAEVLGVVKYEVPIPVGMAGEVCNIGFEHTVNFDIDNIKNYPHVFSDADLIEITEKVHGTFMMVGGFPEGGFTHDEIMSDGRVFCASKGLGGRGLVFKDNEVNAKNIYIRVTKALELDSIVKNLADHYKTEVCILGEVFGKGVQDMEYDCAVNEPQFRVFDICIKKEGYWFWLERPLVESICEQSNLVMATVLYSGVYDKDKILELTDGKETISGNSVHLREGVVVRDLNVNARHPDIGRKILKSVSFDYLNRKGGTEYN